VPSELAHNEPLRSCTYVLDLLADLYTSGVRTTIYIPDRLAAELERLKGSINVSAVCQAALEREVNRMNT
jgi:post-segregation antitoxin (ccd killing protein)